ncbi:MAG TPA: TonB-dependent receptor [Steroidobacter sp.]|nr:TonB-dependent receptor [Steroidobacter sp.]
MKQPHLLLGCLIAGLLSCTVVNAEVRGRRVSEVLNELRAQGLTFIYNAEIVPDSLRVLDEPRALGGLDLAREVLAAHGLALSQATRDVFAVIREPASGAPVAAAAPAPHAPNGRVEEIVVQTSRYTLASGPLAGPLFISEEQLLHQPRLADESLRAVQRLPGTAANGFSSLGSVRGGEPSETAILLDGLRLYEPFHLKNFLSPVSLLDSRLLAGIEFQSGGFSVEYGDRMSSIIEAATISPKAQRYYELGLNLFHASALASQRFDEGRGLALLSARRSNVGELARLSEQDFGKPQYYDGFGKVEYSLSEDTDLAFDMLTSSDSIEAVRQRGVERASARYQNVYSWATIDRRWSSDANSRLIFSFTELHNNRTGQINDPGRRIGRVRDEREFNIVGIRLDNVLTRADVEYRYGGELRRLWGGYDYASELAFAADYPFPGSPAAVNSRAVAPNPDGFESGAYADARIALNDRWALQSGLRVDGQTYDGAEGPQWSPRVSVLYALGPRTQLRASWGRYFQSQGVNELQVEDGVDQFYPAQSAEHAIVAFEHAFERGVDLRLEAYWKDYRRLNPRFENMFDPLVLFPEAEFDRVRIDPERATAKGIELLARLRPHGAWSGSLAYAWSRAEDRIDGTDIARSWDQRHALNLSLMWASGPWTVAAVNSYHTGWPTTELRLVRDGDLRRIDESQRNRRRYAHYNSLDLRATRTFALERGALDFFLEATNALSRENPCCTDYEMRSGPDDSVIIERDVDSWLPLVPSIGVLWRY